MARRPRPEFPAINALPGEVPMLDLVRVLGVFARQIEEYLGAIQTQLDGLDNQAAPLDRITTTGLAGPDLRTGMLAYQQGGQWTPARSTNAATYARGVAVLVANNRVTIQSALIANVAVEQSFLSMGTLLWLSSGGLATSGVPDPTDPDTVIIQEIGHTIENVREGQVTCILNLRIVPELV